MFGYRQLQTKNLIKDRKPKAREEKHEFGREKPMASAQPSEMDMTSQINQRAEESKNNRNKARQEGRTYGQEVINRDVQGLTPQQRQSIQYEASQRINRDTQAAQRKMLGEQGRRGIGGKSGIAFAQQQELARAGQDAQGQVHRDTEKLNADLALKKLAAMFNIEQGEASQSQLDRQMAIDELELSSEKKRQRAIEEQMNRLFSRL